MKSTLLQIAFLGSCLAFSLHGNAVHAEEGHHHRPVRQEEQLVPTFTASTAKSFQALLDDAMAVMQSDMANATMNGVPSHDFISMMLPHHQGAIDMAKALLLTNPEPGLRNLAQGIIAEQQIEIQLMKLWLAQHPAR